MTVLMVKYCPLWITEYGMTRWFSPISTLLCTVALVSCGGESVSDIHLNTDQTPAQCSRESIEGELRSALSSVSTDTDFSFYLEDKNGDSFSFNRGNSTLETQYESASTSKWVSAAIILQVVDRGLLALDDKPQNYLSESDWGIPNDHPLSTITLHHLLNFTSGLTESALCENLPNIEYFQCVSNIADNNLSSNVPPGSEFFYNSNHLQVAGAMAIQAGGYENWLELFDEFKSVTGLFPHSNYNLPSSDNPRLAGGMTWSGVDYIDFIRAYRDADLYSSRSPVETAISDQIANVTIAKSPAYSGLEEDWHYGYGVWVECHKTEFTSDCADNPTVSSPGAYGAYPFLNWQTQSFGLIARQGELGSFREGYAVFNSARQWVDEWVACE